MSAATKNKLQEISHKCSKERNTNVIDTKIHHLIKPNKTDIEEESLIFLQKVQSLHPVHSQHRRRKSPTRKRSYTNKHQPIKIKKLKV